MASVETVIISVKITTNAPKNRICGFLSDGSLKIALQAVPEKGKANQALITFLAGYLNISKSQIEIITGHTSPKKRIQFKAMSKTQLYDQLAIKPI